MMDEVEGGDTSDITNGKLSDLVRRGLQVKSEISRDKTVHLIYLTALRPNTGHAILSRNRIF